MEHHQHDDARLRRTQQFRGQTRPVGAGGGEDSAADPEAERKTPSAPQSTARRARQSGRRACHDEKPSGKAHGWRRQLAADARTGGPWRGFLPALLAAAASSRSRRSSSAMTSGGNTGSEGTCATQWRAPLVRCPLSRTRARKSCAQKGQTVPWTRERSGHAT